ncbi:Uncharacterised protein [Chlamydia trachomatis]|nr:Uncharacterised protein [Chlamydia trachomatis]
MDFKEAGAYHLLNKVANYKKLVKMASLTGIIMLESNAECYRVEQTVSCILNVSQLSTVDVFANTTGLFIYP